MRSAARVAGGFTLLEVLIVATILAVVASIGVPGYRSALRTARITKAVQELRVISMAIDQYRAANGGQLPYTLYEIGYGGRLDPWGLPYCYLNYSAGTGDGLTWAVEAGLVDPAAVGGASDPTSTGSSSGAGPATGGTSAGGSGSASSGTTSSGSGSTTGGGTTSSGSTSSGTGGSGSGGSTSGGGTSGGSTSGTGSSSGTSGSNSGPGSTSSSGSSSSNSGNNSGPGSNSGSGSRGSGSASTGTTQGGGAAAQAPRDPPGPGSGAASPPESLGMLVSQVTGSLRGRELAAFLQALRDGQVMVDVPVETTRRRDRYMFPLNTDYDLFSLGPDGRTAASLNQAMSLDDVIRANDGGFFGTAANY